MDDTPIYDGYVDQVSPNPAPEAVSVPVFIVRETVALLFVLVWVLLLVWDILEGADTRVPFWLNAVGVGVLAYALGVNVAVLTSFRKPSPRSVVKAVRQAREGE